MAKTRGRPPNDNQKQLTILLCSRINLSSMLSASTLEELFGVRSDPPGNKWRRWSRGLYAMAPELRDKIAKIAIARGWITDEALQPLGEDAAYGWAVRGESLAATRDKARVLKAKLKEFERAKKAATTAIEKLQALLPSREGNFGGEIAVAHVDYEEVRRVQDELDGEVQVRGLRCGHDEEFLRQLENTKEKIDGLWVPIWEHLHETINPD